MPSRFSDDATPAKRLEILAKEATSVAKKAKRHNQSLSGAGFYAGKLAALRILATNAFADLQAGTPGDTSALTELIATVFSPKTDAKGRREAERELTFALRTTWRDGEKPQQGVGDTIFPQTLLEQTRRGYLIALGRQINGCFRSQYYDGCAVLMRRLFEISIIEAFEARKIAGKITDAHGNYFQLSDLVNATLSETTFKLSRNFKRALPSLRDSGHLSAHGRSYFAQKEDIEKLQPAFRVTVEELLRVADLL